jgi:hypothetical protein
MRDLDPAEREAAMAACHQRSADKLLALAFKNGGIYTKLGQHIGQLVRSSAAVAAPAAARPARATRRPAPPARP